MSEQQDKPMERSGGAARGATSKVGGGAALTRHLIRPPQFSIERTRARAPASKRR
jgi:hypothetical protein